MAPLKTHKIYIAGHTGMLGSSILRGLKSRNYTNLVLRTRQELNLTNQAAVEDFFKSEKPDFVFLAAARVGGIKSNIEHPALFLRDNLQIQTNVITSAHQHGCKKLIFAGSSCIYPRMSPQPMQEDLLLTGPLEPTNESYALAKIAGIKLCASMRKEFDFNSVTIQPPNLYGEGDHFDLETSHVIGALIHRFYVAKRDNVKKLILWGTGNARREFMYVDDAADAFIFALEQSNLLEPMYNAGTNIDISIKELAYKIATLIGYTGEIMFDSNHPDGMPQKLMNSEKFQQLGWKPRYTLDQGLEKTYAYFLSEYAPSIT